ncbi:WD40/YVTN/BNR-like repeat-containing protein [Ekhidna sp.]|uniref:WD40/YVTN/BNR-like repeat-containing protein n=1 Tax=Ekhidna sp. TaxID=2608089 RepID=UPI003518F442
MKLAVYIIIHLTFFNGSGQTTEPAKPLSDSLTIHKLAYKNQVLWGVDYGTGIILRSTDTGKSWESAAILKAEYFEKIQFIDDLVGFVCGDYGYVYKTNDGGKSWKEISPPIDGRITERYRNDSTKSQQPEGQFIAYYDMSFKDSKNGFVSGFKMRPKVGGSSFQPLAFTTQDGGISWDETTIKELKKHEFIPTEEQEQVYQGGVFSLGDQLKWRTKKVEGEFVVQKSSDGGQSWDASRLPGYNGKDKWMLRKILFLDNQRGLVFGGTLDDKEKALLFLTHDGGLNWVQHEVDWPHIHDAILVENSIFISGKNGFFKVIDPSTLRSPWTSLEELDLKYQIDGSISGLEIRDTAAFKQISRSTFHVIKRSKEFTYIGIRSNNSTILNAYLINADSFKVFHASAALGEVSYQREKQNFTTQSDEFEWIYRDPNSWDEKHPEGANSIESFYDRFGWMASTWTMGSYREFEMLISNQHFADQSKLLVSFSAVRGEEYQTLFFLGGEEVSLTGDDELDKSLHNGYLKSPVQINDDIYD